MSIRRDPKTGIYQLDISINGLPRLQRTADTKDRDAAQELHDMLRADMWRQRRLGVRPAGKTWDDLVAAWRKRCEKNKKRSIADDEDKLEWLAPHLAGRTLTDITARTMIDGIERTLVEAVIDKRAQAPKKTRGKGLPAPATVNRYASLIIAMLNHAKALGWIDIVPTIAKRKEPNEDETGLWITQEEAQRLVAELPPHLAAMARFSLATGVRQANCTHLEWRRVDLERRVAWVDAADAKGKRTLRVQLRGDALDVLAAQKGLHPRWVFPYQHRTPQGEPIGEPGPIDDPAGEAWEKAKARAGIDPAFRWHDLRHTWATWHVRNGTPLEVLQKLGGWREYRMVLRYAKFAPDHLAEYAENAGLLPRPAPALRVVG